MSGNKIETEKEKVCKKQLKEGRENNQTIRVSKREKMKRRE